MHLSIVDVGLVCLAGKCPSVHTSCRSFIVANPDRALFSPAHLTIQAYLSLHSACICGCSVLSGLGVSLVFVNIFLFLLWACPLLLGGVPGRC